MSTFGQKLFAGIAECFDWQHFLAEQKAVERRHLNAFKTVRDRLMPCLESAGWPDPEDFPWLERTWKPRLVERDEAEYFCMVKRLKQEYQLSLSSGRWAMFNELVAWEVVPVSLCSLVHKWFDQFQRQSTLFKHCKNSAAQVFSVVSAFLVGETSFRVKPSSLRKTGHSSTQRGRALQRGAFNGQAGSFGSIMAQSKPDFFWGKQVRVIGPILRPNAAKVAAFLDSDRKLLLPRVEAQTRRNAKGHCWHAVFVHHCSRCCVGPDAALERWFSLIHMVWDSATNLSPDRIVNRLLLKDAGISCVGGQRDEMFVATISNILMTSLKKRPLLTRQGRAKRRRLGVPADRSFRTEALPAEADKKAVASGRQKTLEEAECLEHFEYVARGPHSLSKQRAAWQQSHKPAVLDPGSRDALEKASGRGTLANRGALQALPVLAEDVRTARKHRAPSDLQQKMNAWLQSDASSSWHQKRAALWA